MEIIILKDKRKLNLALDNTERLGMCVGVRFGAVGIYGSTETDIGIGVMQKMTMMEEEEESQKEGGEGG